MKSGKLFASVALAALTAACSQESLQFEAAPGLQERPTVNVELSFDEDAVEFASEETRSYFGKPAGQKGYQWIFKEGDKIGGLLMDEWNGKGCGIENFSIVDYVHTNYAFIRETGEDGKPKWVTPAQAPVCEGNYFFYFPYNDTFNHRGYVAWDVNPVQPQYNENGELFQMQTVKENQKWIGYKYVGHEMEGKVNKIDFDFVPLFAMPTFDFINMTGAELTVNKIDVRVTSNDAAAINPWGQHSLMATTMVLAPYTGGFGSVNKTWEGEEGEDKFAEHTSLMYKHAQRYTKFGTDEDYVWPIGIDDDSKQPVSWSWDASMAVANKILFPLNENHTAESIRRQATYNYTADFSKVEGGYKVGPTEHIQAMLVMPAGYYYWNTCKDGENTRTSGAWWSGQTFEALVYVTTPAGDDYVVRLDLGRPQTQGATNGSNFDDVNSGAAPKFLAPGVTTKFLASFDASALQSYNVTDFKVTSTEELAWLIKETETNQGYYDLNVTTSGKRVAFDNTIDSLLAARPKVRLNVHGEITITADSVDAINKLYFNNPMLFTKLNIETAQVKKAEPIYAENNDEIVYESKIMNNCEIFVAQSGSLNTEKNGIDIFGNITNEGTVFAQNIKGNVDNKGLMTAVDIVGSVTNSGSGDLTADNVYGTVNNSATITINKNVTKKVTNSGTATIANAEEVIQNNGTMTLKGAEYKKAVSNTKTMTVAGKSTFKSTLSNAAGATITFDADDADVTCEDKFTNDGEANVNSAVIVKNKAINKGTIDVKEGAKLVGANNDPVEIENHKKATINNNGTVHNVFNEGSITTGSKSYTVINSKPGADEDAAAVGGEGYVNNTALGDVSYQNDGTQTVELIISDITGMEYFDVMSKIDNSDANKLTISKGTIKFSENPNCIYGYAIYGHIADNESVTTSTTGGWGSVSTVNKVNSYFDKGVVIGDVTVEKCETSGGSEYPVVFFTNGMTITNSLFCNLYSDVAVIKGVKEGTTVDVNGKLSVADHGRFRGSASAKLTIDFKGGEVHNAGIIQYTAEKYEAAPGNTWTGNATK